MKDQDSVTIVRNSQMANPSTFGGRRMKIILVRSLLVAGPSWLAGQNLDDYHPRGHNPDVYNTNPDGSFPKTGAALPKTSAKTRENKQNNRYDFPASRNVAVTLRAMLARGNDVNRFTNGHGAQITGYVVSCVSGGGAHRNPPAHSGKSCNNGATDVHDTDTHIDVVLSPNDRAVKTRHVIVEVTPRVRELMRQRGTDWSTNTLASKLKNHWVEFGGWVFFDPDHVAEARNTHPQDPQHKNWRAGRRGKHPGTQIFGLDRPPADLANSQPPRRVHRARKQNPI